MKNFILFLILLVPSFAQDPAPVVPVVEPIPLSLVCPPCDCSAQLPSPAVKTALEAIDRFEQIEKFQDATLTPVPVPSTPVVVPAVPEATP